MRYLFSNPLACRVDWKKDVASLIFICGLSNVCFFGGALSVRKKRTYHKIYTCDKAVAVIILLDAGVTREQVPRWFGLSDRTLRWYLKQGGDAKAVGRPERCPRCGK